MKNIKRVAIQTLEMIIKKEIQVPRDRKGSFNSMLVKKRESTTDGYRKPNYFFIYQRNEYFRHRKTNKRIIQF